MMGFSSGWLMSKSDRLQTLLGAELTQPLHNITILLAMQNLETHLANVGLGPASHCQWLVTGWLTGLVG